MRPGVAWEDMHILAETVIARGLLALGILVGEEKEVLALHLAAIFFPHGLGHFLGLDTHDPGGYPKGVERIDRAGIKYLRARRTLEEGMVITVEPGLYFNPVLLEEAFNDPVRKNYLNKEKIEAFRHFGGVRIEDDVIVTKDGVENMTKVPRTVEEIEAVMAGKPWSI
eukprot:TRINITY_DN1049_c0_g1_i1.p1 TRINITY_DN1049_c0_g1~~TRINITY_DN1049_c0_g1_i1.p1  ORF type:complete len:188 (-),score=19.84 TRINITY_DN1049_c0_g1_i1:56-559(-)